MRMVIQAHSGHKYFSSKKRIAAALGPYTCFGAVPQMRVDLSDGYN